MMTEVESSDYLHTCRSEFWRKVFAAELDYLRPYLRPGDEILSVGCGPAIIESGLHEHGFAVVGLDVSREAIAEGFGVQGEFFLASPTIRFFQVANPGRQLSMLFKGSRHRLLPMTGLNRYCSSAQGDSRRGWARIRNSHHLYDPFLPDVSQAQQKELFCPPKRR